MLPRSHRLALVTLAAGLISAVTVSGALAQDPSASPGASASPAASATPAPPTLAPSPLALGKTVVVLMPSTDDPYRAAWAAAAQDEAIRQGITLTIVENKFDQAEQDGQVQQQIAAATRPDAYVWWPTNNTAGVPSLQALAATGVPVFQASQLPAATAQGSWTAYVGANDIVNGSIAGQLLVAARNKLTSAGTLTLHTEGGNAIVLKLSAGYASADDRMTGFHTTADPAKIAVIAEGVAGFDAQAGYTTAQTLITANKDAGIDLLYAQNDALAVGAIQALEEAGYTPGTDVAVIGGSCGGLLVPLELGKQYATGLQAPSLEGMFAIQTVSRYLATGVVTDGDYTAPADTDAMPAFPTDISKNNYLPDPTVIGTDLDTTKLWGSTARDLCTY